MPASSYRFIATVALIALSVAACGGSSSSSSPDSTGGNESASGPAVVDDSLPAECDNKTPLRVTVPGVPELSGDFAVAGGVVLPFAILPGPGSLIDLSLDEIEAAVDASELRGYAMAVTDFPYGLDDAGSFYSLFSRPSLPESGGTTIVLTVIPPEGPLAAGSVIAVGTPLSYDADLQTSAASTGEYIESNRAEVPMLGGSPTDFSGSVEVIAITEHSVCLSWSTRAPTFGSDEVGFVTIEGVASAPLLQLSARNSMG